jgi:FkbM family methyltransferase
MTNHQEGVNSWERHDLVRRGFSLKLYKVIRSLQCKIKKILVLCLPKRFIYIIENYLYFRSMRFIPNKVYRYCGYILPYTPTRPIIQVIESGSYWEERLTSTIIEELARTNTPHPLVLDIGANVGLITLSILASCPSVKVIAFEPAPFQCNLLEKTISANGLIDRVKVQKTALGQSRGRMRFSTHIGIDASGLDGFFDTGVGGPAKQIIVDVDTLDNWWIANGSPSVNIIKLDTEGSELWILQGAVQVLQTCRPILFIEIQPDHLKHYPYSLQDMIMWLGNCGYAIYTLDGRRIPKQDFQFYFGGYNNFVVRPLSLSALD